MFAQLVFILIRIRSVNAFSGRLNSIDSLQIPPTGHFGIAKTKIGRLMQSYACLKNRRPNFCICFCNCKEETKKEVTEEELPSRLTSQMSSAYHGTTESGTTNGVGLDDLQKCRPVSVIPWNYNEVLQGNFFNLRS